MICWVSEILIFGPALWFLGPNICHFGFVVFGEAICALACAKDNFFQMTQPHSKSEKLE